MLYGNEVKRDCIFYEEYQDMGARADFCNFKGHGWDNTEAAVCRNCKKYIPSETVRAIFRHLLEEAKEDQNE